MLGLDDGRLWHKEDAFTFAGEQADADKLAGQQLVVGIVEFGAQLLGAERGVDIAGQEIEFAGLGVNFAIRQNQLDAGDALGCQAAIRKLGEIAFAKTEADPQRIHLVNRGQQAVSANADQIALRLGGTSGGAADRRGDRRPRQVQFGLAQYRLGNGIGRNGIVVIFLADCLAVDQRFQAVHFTRCLLGLGLGIGQGDFIG